MGGTRKVLRYLPRTRAGDAIWSTLFFLTHRYRLPRLRRPRTFTEHLFARRYGDWLVDPRRCALCDKILAKDYINDRVGERYSVPTLALLRSHEEIDRFEFPERCVVKPSHMSGRVQLKRSPEAAIDRGRLHRALDADYSEEWREANYRGIAHGILVEPFVFGGDFVPSDIKVFCFHGEPKLIMVVLDRFGASTQRLYTPRWEPLKATYSHSKIGVSEPAPANLDELLDVCRALAKDFDFLRVDLYSNGTDVKVGEFTILPGAGMHYPSMRPRAADLAAAQLFRDPEAEPSRVFAPFIDRFDPDRALLTVAPDSCVPEPIVAAPIPAAALAPTGIAQGSE